MCQCGAPPVDDSCITNTFEHAFVCDNVLILSTTTCHIIEYCAHLCNQFIVLYIYFFFYVLFFHKTFRFVFALISLAAGSDSRGNLTWSILVSFLTPQKFAILIRVMTFISTVCIYYGQQCVFGVHRTGVLTASPNSTESEKHLNEMIASVGSFLDIE